MADQMQYAHIVTPADGPVRFLCGRATTKASGSLRRMLALALAAVLLGPLAARAQYPDKPVRIIVPVAAGGGVDVMARLIAQKLSERLGQQFFVENREASPACVARMPPEAH